MYLVSACLAGFNTRYDGKNSTDDKVVRLVEKGEALPVCPEQLSGLPTPRPPVEFKGGGGSGLLDDKIKAVGEDGADYSGALKKGASAIIEIASIYGIKEAILKDGSPSCGVTYVYSNGVKVSGRGAAAEALFRAGIRVKTIDSL